MIFDEVMQLEQYSNTFNGRILNDKETKEGLLH